MIIVPGEAVTRGMTAPAGAISAIVVREVADAVLEVADAVVAAEVAASSFAIDASDTTTARSRPPLMLAPG